jgi:hypothetical protein
MVLMCLQRLTVFAAIALFVASGCGINKIPTLDEQVKAAWSEVSAPSAGITLCAQWYSMREKIVAPVGLKRL